ncbi:MAG: hypothetical protein NTV49_14295 [Kiritimatiellaeota bacterium]|nr:hypothetical protein [Kiritimatiellota bacterium]
MLAPRTIVTALRTTAYSGLAGWLAISNEQAQGLLDAVIFGAVLADFLTWGIRSIALLPFYVWHKSWEACVHVAFGYAFYRLGGFELKADIQYVVIAFFVFLLVAALKLSYYAVLLVTDNGDGLEP